jgi:hypothetical protein
MVGYLIFHNIPVIYAFFFFSSEVMKDIQLRVTMNSNRNRVRVRSLPDLSMNDDQFMASLHVAELNLRDIRDYTEAKILGDASFKEFIKGGIVDWSKLFRLKFSGSKDQEAKHVMSR